ncbi:Uncharacterized membrane protein [Ensifer adhaerens]|nr:Uncharacterized membrane protein [Ensifer adhaerens]
MNLQPFLDASFAVQFHVLTVMPAAFLGAYVLLTRKGTPRHKLLGRIWMSLMVLTALSTFFIHQIRVWGDFSPIHILSVVVITSCGLAIWHIRRGNVRAHKTALISAYIGGIFGAGLFTFWPGRLMNEMLLGGSAGSTPEQVRHSIIAAGVVVALGYAYTVYVTRFRSVPRRARNVRTTENA